MKTLISSILFAFTAASAAYADAPASRDTLYETDKKLALTEFGKAQQSACVQAFQSRYPQMFHLDGQLQFSSALSQTVYDQLFWNGDRQRGLAFTAPVSSPDKHATLICYYSVTHNHLAFQDAFVMPLNQLASNQ